MKHTPSAHLNRPLSALAALSFLALAPSSWAEPSDAPENKIAPESETSIKPKPAEPLVKKISPTTYQIGKIRLNTETREITLPAQTNITNPGTIIEYLLVHLNGEKVHEALLVTEADPTHVNLAFKLLHYKESTELFRELKKDGTPGETYPVVADDIKKAARFSIHLTWKQGEQTKKAPVTDWLQHRITKKPMPSTPWVYNGSYILNTKFKAKLTGSIFTIFPDLGAIANYSGKDREDDTLWFPGPKIPPEGTAVTVTLKPWK